MTEKSFITINKAVGDGPAGQARIRHIPFKFNSLLSRNNKSYSLKLNSRTSCSVVSTVLIKWQKKKLSMMKIFKLFVSDHLKTERFRLGLKARRPRDFSVKKLTTFGLALYVYFPFLHLLFLYDSITVPRCNLVHSMINVGSRVNVECCYLFQTDYKTDNKPTSPFIHFILHWPGIFIYLTA